MRRKLTKAERIQIHNICNGHCSYCGSKLEYKDMQVDHTESLRKGGEDSIKNMLPACRSCNHYKSTLGIEEFRKYLQEIPNRLIRDNIPYQVGIRFGLLKHNQEDIIFYFEKIGVKTNGSGEKQ